MAYTQQDLDDLKAAIASGVMEVTINDRATKFRSLTEMLRTKALIEKDLTASPVSQDRILRASYRRDYQ